jgi:hypothetical protein
MANVRQLVPRSVLDRGDSTAEPIYVPLTDFTPWKGIGFDTRERVVKSRAGVPVTFVEADPDINEAVDAAYRASSAGTPEASLTAC